MVKVRYLTHVRLIYPSLFIIIFLILSAPLINVKASEVYTTNSSVYFTGNYSEINSIADVDPTNVESPFYNKVNYQKGHAVLPNTGDYSVFSSFVLPSVLIILSFGIVYFNKKVN